LLTQPVDSSQLEKFYKKVRPGGWWGPMSRKFPEIESGFDAGKSWVGWFLGLMFIWGGLLGVGYMVTGKMALGLTLTVVSILAGAGTLFLAQKSFDRNV